MSEHLAIKTDKAGDWKKRKEPVAIKDLSPRESDRGRKSSWAHRKETEDISHVVLSDPQRATCELQALALFIFDQRNPTSARRSTVRGISVSRNAIAPELVLEEPSEHPIAAYSTTHRSLLLEDDDRRAELVSRILSEEDAFYPWQYSRAEMAELLAKLLEVDGIAPEFRYDAQSLLAQWRS